MNVVLWDVATIKLTNQEKLMSDLSVFIDSSLVQRNCMIGHHKIKIALGNATKVSLSCVAFVNKKIFIVNISWRCSFLEQKII